MHSRDDQPVPWLLALMRGRPSQPDGSDEPPRRRRWPFALAGLSLIGVGVWVASTVVPTAAPSPRWTVADLPSVPSEADNGWFQVASPGADVDMPKPLTRLIDASEQDWTTIDQASLREFLAREDVREVLARVEAAARAPTFADGCELEGPCSLFSWHRAHEIALLDAIAVALAGNEAEAAARVARLLRLDAAHLGSARSVISVLVAMANLDDALASAAVLEQRLSSSETPAAASELRAAVEAIDVDAVDLRPMVVASYLLYTQTLDAFARGEKPSVEVPGPGWLYNRALTQREVDERFARRYQAAADGDFYGALGGGERWPKQELGWWLRNPGGDLLLEALYFNPESVVEDMLEKREKIEHARASVLGRPRTLASK